MTMTTERAVALPAFEGHEVVGATLRITKAGDGLSEALELFPEALEQGQRVRFVLEGIVEQVNHRPKDAKDSTDGRLVRQHTVATTSITRVYDDDSGPITAILEGAAEKLKARRDEISGQQSLDTDPGYAGERLDDIAE